MGVWGACVVVCLERSADLHMAQLMPLPLLTLAPVKSRLVLQRAVKLVCVCVCVCVRASVRACVRACV